LVNEYNNAIAILSGQKLITSGKFANVITDMRVIIQFEQDYGNSDTLKIQEYMAAMAKLENVSIINE
jgi:hypothetical protein